jgi:hypothetical protein
MPKKLPKKFYKKIVKDVDVVTLPVKKQQFPSIPRFIPEHLRMPALSLPPITKIGSFTLPAIIQSRVFLFNFTAGFLVMAMGIVGMDVRQNTQRLEIMRQKRNIVEQQITYWEGVVGKYANYRDGLYQLALLEYRIGNKQAATDYARKALAIDPDFVQARGFMEKLIDLDSI